MKFTLKFRVWHWLNAIVVLGLLATVFLRKTFLSWRTNSEILIDKLFDMDIDITVTQAKILAKAIRAGMWEWHIVLGYALAFLIVFRAYIYLTDKSKKHSFSSLSLHKKGREISYYIVYTTLTFLTLTGFVIYFYKDLGVLKETAHTIKEIHEMSFYIIMYFVPLHLTGIVITEIRYKKSLISRMIHGIDKKV